jgi:hypothetical protein
MSRHNPTLVPQIPQASRRALLMGLAAAATPMAPTLATAMGGLPTSPATDPDAELLELVGRFIELTPGITGQPLAGTGRPS